MQKITKKLTQLFFIVCTSIITTTPVSAQGFLLDFNNDPQGNPIDAIAIDSESDANRIDVGSLFNSLGIDISTSGTNAPLGVFNSNCLPFNNDGTPGTSNNGFTQPCNINGGTGDPDLATGQGSYNNITFDTEPQGNLLILEENPGNGIPDDIGSGGSIIFDFDRSILSRVIVGDITFVDDAAGNVEINFLDGGTDVIVPFDLEEENQLFSISEIFNVNNLFNREVNNITINFDGSGGLASLFFTEFEFAPIEVPETSNIFGLFVMVGLGVILKNNSKII